MRRMRRVMDDTKDRRSVLTGTLLAISLPVLLLPPKGGKLLIETSGRMRWPGKSTFAVDPQVE